MAVQVVTLLSAATSTGAGGSFAMRHGGERTFQATGQTSSGVGAAAVVIQASNDGEYWIDLGTITLTLGITTTTDGFASSAAWKLIRANVSSISGTGAAVTVIAGG